jgi:hypothetical protein
LVWEVTTQIMLELFDTVWVGKDEVIVDHAVDLTLPVRDFNARLRVALMSPLPLVGLVRDWDCR